MEQRDLVFRQKFLGVMTRLNAGDRNSPEVRRQVGAIANELTRQAGTRAWNDLKRRADGPTFNSLLGLFQKQSESAARMKDDKAVFCFEVLAVSLIARTQRQEDLLEGVRILDQFIANCEKAARKAGIAVIPSSRRGGK